MAMIKKTKKTVIFLILILSIFILVGCSDGKKNEEQILKEKVIQELEYLDAKIINMLNRLNNINFENYTVISEKISIGENQDVSAKNAEEEDSESAASSDDKTEGSNDIINVTKMEPDTILATDSSNIDWTTLKNEIELLNSSWSVIILDLYSLKLNSDEILLFSATLDKCILSIKDENSRDSLSNLSELYGFIPIYLAGLNEEQSRMNIKQTKAYIIKSYALVEQDNWVEIMKNIQEADSVFKRVITDVEYVKTREYKINQAYVLLKELQQSINSKDSKLFYIKYKNVMESLNVL